MTISFDLDDTLVSGGTFKLEKQTMLHRLLLLERLRFGTIYLLKTLQSRDHKIFVYTTSYRSKMRIRLMFLAYGIWIDEVINQQKHVKTLGTLAKSISKLPSRFNIDVHVDDSKGVQIEGERYGFATIIISPEEENWVDLILKKLATIQ